MLIKMLTVILVLLCSAINILAYVDSPVPTWTDPMVTKYPYESLDYLPKTISSAHTKGWKYVPVKPLNQQKDVKVKVYCPVIDKTLCSLYDINGRIVGFMISVRVNHPYTHRSPLQMYNSLWFKTQEIGYLGDKYFTMEIYFVTEEHLKDPGRGMPVVSVGEDFRIVMRNNTSIKIPVYNETSLQKSGWKKQNCFGGKGTHYIYNLDKLEESNCTNLMPIVLLVKNGQIVGFSFIIPGLYQSHNLMWYERTTKRMLIRRFPDAPNCLKKWANKYKFSTIYVTLAPIAYMKTCIKTDYPDLSVWRKMQNFFTG